MARPHLSAPARNSPSSKSRTASIGQKRLAAFPTKYQTPYPTTRQPTSRLAVRGSARVQPQPVNSKAARMTARPSPLPVEENIPSAPEPVHSCARLANSNKSCLNNSARGLQTPPPRGHHIPNPKPTNPPLTYPSLFHQPLFLAPCQEESPSASQTLCPRLSASLEAYQ